MATKTQDQKKVRPIYVVGHVNPDTDAIASAMGYAWFLGEQRAEPVIAGRAGPINPQTNWVLNRLDLEPPEFFTDASPRFQSVARRLDSVHPDRPLRDAWTILNRTGTVAPVVETDGKPFGLITGFSLFKWLNRLLGAHPERHDMAVTEIYDIPCRDVADTGVPTFQASTRIRDVLPRILRGEHNDFWVVDETGRYLGVCRQPDLLNPPRWQVILVDHNEESQSIGSLDEADLIEVLDHHRLGNSPTRLPISFTVDTVGSTSTLVSERIEEAGLSAPPALAGLLLAGVISDTLLLTSPTTTPRDSKALDRLARWALVGGAPLEGETVESYGKEVLQAGAGLATQDPDEVVTRDLKLYDGAESQFGIAQVEVTDLNEIGDHLDELAQALEALIDRRGLEFALLMVTDIVEGSSRIIARNAPPALDELPYKRLSDGTLDASGVVSRKKQLLPVVLALLEV
ncbi:MAG: DHH family phosphoesterase [Anaerolineales bacterium]